MNSIHPVRYKIQLEPDLSTFKFSGRVELIAEAPEPVDSVRLNILELAVWSCWVKVDDEFIQCPFQVDPRAEGCPSRADDRTINVNDRL